MPAVRVTGLDSLRKRLATLGHLSGLDAALRAEAEAIAAAAKGNLEGHGELASSVEIIPEGQALSPRYAIGTKNPEGWFLEFGTTRIAASPWLGPPFQARLPAVNHALRKVVSGTLKALGKG